MSACPFIRKEGPCHKPRGHAGDHEPIPWDEWEAKEAERRAEREARCLAAGDSSPSIELPPVEDN